MNKPEYIKVNNTELPTNEMGIIRLLVQKGVSIENIKEIEIGLNWDDYRNDQVTIRVSRLT